MPDHPSLLQTYIWQELDIAPRFPILKKFLKFWEMTLEGKLYIGQGRAREADQPGEFRYFGGEFVVNSACARLLFRSQNHNHLPAFEAGVGFDLA